MILLPSPAFAKKSTGSNLLSLEVIILTWLSGFPEMPMCSVGRADKLYTLSTARFYTFRQVWELRMSEDIRTCRRRTNEAARDQVAKGEPSGPGVDGIAFPLG